MIDDLDRLTVRLAEQEAVANGLRSAIELARRMDVFGSEPPLDTYAWRGATDLFRADHPFAALIAAALHQADSTNAALIRACWPTLSETAQARYTAPGGRLPEDGR